MRRQSRERGSIAILLAVLLTAFMTVGALSIDVGMLYQERRQLQTAVDAAALSGAQALAEGNGAGEADAIARRYVADNANVPPDTVSVSFPGADSIRVTADTSRQLFLAKVFGRDTSGVSASATARYGPATAVGNLAPFLVPLQYVTEHTGPANAKAFELGQDRPLEQGQPRPGGPQKGYFWLCDFNAGSGGRPDYADWIIEGYPGEVGIGFVANGEGVKSSLDAALTARTGEDPKIVIPLYDFTEGGGSGGVYHVVGFAELYVTGFDLQGSPKSVSGYFTNGTVVAGAGGGVPPSVDFGIRALWLVE